MWVGDVHETQLVYDNAGNLVAMKAPNGAESRWQYDGFGRCTAATDPKGNVRKREHDTLGRVIRVHEPDGNVRTVEYDAEGNPVHVKDQQRDVRFTYQGMGRLASRTEAGTTVKFVYDTEERLVRIENEHGIPYSFELGPTGLVDVELGFDDLKRRYFRDAGGRVTKVLRPKRKTAEYGYEINGRVTCVKHHDGTKDAGARSLIVRA